MKLNLVTNFATFGNFGGLYQSNYGSSFVQNVMEALVLIYHVEKNQKMWNFILIRALFWTVLWKRAIFTK